MTALITGATGFIGSRLLQPGDRAKRAAEDAVLEAGAKFGMHVVNLRLAGEGGLAEGGILK